MSQTVDAQVPDRDDAVVDIGELRSPFFALVALDACDVDDQSRVVVRAGPDGEGAGAGKADVDGRRLSPAARREFGHGELHLAVATALVPRS
jgi:hypothetical protein